MSDIPYLTIDDKKNTWFLDDDTPALIVEGKSDFYIYGKLLTYSKLNWEQIDLVVGECKNEIIKQHNNGIPFKYIALLDSDYDICKMRCIIDPKIIYTHFYNIENYLVSETVLIQTASDYKTIHDSEFNSSEFLRTIEESLMPYILISVGKMDNDWKFSFEKSSIEKWDYQTNKKIIHGEMEKFLITQLQKENIIINEVDWFKLGESLENYLEEYEIDNLLNGKRKLEATYFHFKDLFKQQMQKKSLLNFTQDLCKNIRFSLAAIELVNMIDDRFKQIWNCKEKDLAKTGS